MKTKRTHSGFFTVLSKAIHAPDSKSKEVVKKKKGKK